MIGGTSELCVSVYDEALCGSVCVGGGGGFRGVVVVVVVGGGWFIRSLYMKHPSPIRGVGVT